MSSEFRKTTSKNFRARCLRFLRLAQNDSLEDIHEEYFRAFDEMLDNLNADDLFGMEGQHDPRAPAPLFTESARTPKQARRKS